MITYSIIKKSQLERASRLDAEYYQPEYLERMKKLKLFSTQKLGDVAYITDGEHGSPIFDEKSGIKYFSAQHVRSGFIDDSEAKNISRIIDQKNKRSRLREGDVLLSTVGTIGFAGLVTEDLLPANIDRHVARIALKEKTLDPHFLVAFLNSPFGRFQTVREATGNVQLNLFIDKIKELVVPKIDSREVNQTVMSAPEQLRNSTLIYSKAEDMLLKELGLKDFKPSEELSYTLNLSDFKSAHRADAEYFQPKFESLRNKIKSQIPKLLAVAPLGELFSIRRGDFVNPDYYCEKARRAYIRIKELPMKGDINYDAVTFVDDNLSGNNLGELTEGDLVFAGIGATLGKTARVPKELEGSFYSNNTARFRLKKIWKDKVDTYYLQVVFQSVVCQMQFEQRQAPTAQAKIADQELKTVLIPILRKPNQEEIADLVHQSHLARKRAKELLQKAKREVEEFVEGKKQLNSKKGS